MFDTFRNAELTKESIEVILPKTLEFGSYVKYAGGGWFNGWKFKFFEESINVKNMNRLMGFFVGYNLPRDYDKLVSEGHIETYK